MVDVDISCVRLGDRVLFATTVHHAPGGDGDVALRLLTMILAELDNSGAGRTVPSQSR